MREVEHTARSERLMERLRQHTTKQFPISVVIVANGGLGFTTSVRYEDRTLDKDFSDNYKEDAYLRVSRLFKPQGYRSWQ